MDIRTKFRYPTQEEIDSIQDKVPGISNFGFKRLFPSNINNLALFTRYDHLYSWDLLLHNRIADFDTCYMYVLVHLNRGVPRTSKEVVNDEERKSNYINVTFYLGYLLFSFQAINDLILQILNVYFECGLPERNVCSKNIKPELQNNYPNIVAVLDNYISATKDINELRNALTHRFNRLEIDNRAILESTTKVIIRMTNDLPDYDSILEIIESSVLKLNDYIKVLKQNITISPS